MKPNNPVFGGGILRIPQIASPNFSIPNQTGWGILQNGSAYFFNVTASGTITATSFAGTDFVINAAGQFFYSGTPALGNLIISIAQSAGTDTFGNAYKGPGLFVYKAGTAQAIGLINTGGVPELQFFSNSGFEQTAANIAAGTSGSGATANMQLLISGPQGSPAGGTDWAQIELLSNNQGATVPAAGFLNYIDTSGSPHEIAAWGSIGFFIANNASPPAASSVGAGLFGSFGHLDYVGADGVSYATGRKTIVTASQIINSTTATILTGTSVTVQANISYRIHAAIPYVENAAAGVPSFQVNGPSAAQVLLATTVTSVTGASATLANLTTALNTPFTVNTMASLSRILRMDGTFFVNTAGTINLRALTSIAADTFTIQAGGIWEVFPVV